MSAATERELATRVTDLENALKAIGRIAADASTTPKARLQRVTGILSMFGCDAGAQPALNLQPSTPNPQSPKDASDA